MDKVKKFLKKVNKKDNLLLEKIISDLRTNNLENLNIRKVIDSDFYRFRKNRFRIIFHYENKTLVIDSIKLKNDKTYRNL